MPPDDLGHNTKPSKKQRMYFFKCAKGSFSCALALAHHSWGSNVSCHIRIGLQDSFQADLFACAAHARHWHRKMLSSASPAGDLSQARTQAGVQDTGLSLASRQGSPGNTSQCP